VAGEGKADLMRVEEASFNFGGEPKTRSAKPNGSRDVGRVQLEGGGACGGR